MIDRLPACYSFVFVRGGGEEHLRWYGLDVCEVSFDVIVVHSLFLLAGEEKYYHFGILWRVFERMNPVGGAARVDSNTVRGFARVAECIQTFLEGVHHVVENALVALLVDYRPDIENRLLEHLCLCLSVEIRCEHGELLTAALHLHVSRV